MKRIASFVIAALALTAAAQAATLPDLGGRTISAVTENAYTPLNFVDPATGQSVGWEYDAVNEIAKRLNLKVEWKTAAWDVMLQAVHDGQFDIGMDGITINDERKQQVNFSDDYLTAKQVILARADEKRFTDGKSFASNADLLIGAQPGTTNYYTALDLLGGEEKKARIKEFETFAVSVQALKTGDVDMVLMDETSAAGYIGASPGAFKIIGDPISSDDFGFVFKKGSDLVAPVNAALQSMKDDGALAKLTQKWFGDYQAKH